MHDEVVIVDCEDKETVLSVTTSRREPHTEDEEFVPDQAFVDYYIRMIFDTIENYRYRLNDSDFAAEHIPIIESYRDLWLSGKFSMADVICMSEKWMDMLRKQRDNYASNIENKIRIAAALGEYSKESDAPKENFWQKIRRFFAGESQQ